MSESSEEAPQGDGAEILAGDEEIQSGSSSGEAQEANMFSPPRFSSKPGEQAENSNSDEDDEDDEDDDDDFAEGAPSKPPSLLATFYASFASKKDSKPKTNKRPR
jgi:hypothetical protein